MKAQANANLAIVASLVSKGSRAAMLTAMLDGRYHPASELAYMAGIKPQTASFHLSKMADAGIVSVVQQGRHRYYGIRDPEVARMLESLLSIAPPAEIKSLRQADEDRAIRSARTCYDHLAGKLGIQLTASLLKMGVLDENHQQFEVTASGEAFFKNFRIDLDQARAKRRSFSHKCLDWSERRHHLAGALGSVLLEKLLELKWIERLPKTRAVRVTEEGKKGFKATFGIEVDGL